MKHIFIINPTAGKYDSRQRIYEMADHLRTAHGLDVQCILTKKQGHAAEIAHASDRLIGIALGAEDYVTDLKTTRSDGIELLFARCMILNAARSAGIAALDTVYSDVNNEEGFIAEATLIKKLGFDGKSVINPRQIEPLHHVFMPSEKDLNKARAIMDAIAEANARGSGVASLKGKMIDKPVVTRAKRLLDLYEAGSKIDEVEEI